MPIINDRLVINGYSINHGIYREHIVPPAALWDGCIQMIEYGHTNEQIHEAIFSNIGNVIISNEIYYILMSR